MKNQFFYLTVLIVFIFAGCGNETEKFNSVDEMVVDAKKSVSEISTADFKAIIDNKEKVTIIDCREQDKFIEGHIPGAINVPRGVLEFSGKITNRRVKLFIYSKDDKIASLAYVTLKKMKYPDVTLLTGGWEAWHKAFPEIIEEGTGTPGEAPPPPKEDGGCGG